MGAKASQFGPGKSGLFGLIRKWEGDLHCLGRLHAELATTDRGDPRWPELHSEASMLEHELAARAAGFELAARRVEEAKET
jgi:hypothetical protein